MENMDNVLPFRRKGKVVETQTVKMERAPSSSTPSLDITKTVVLNIFVLTVSLLIVNLLMKYL